MKSEDSGHHHRLEGSITAIFISIHTTKNCKDDCALQMTFFITRRYSTIRATSSIGAHHHFQSRHFEDYRSREVIQNYNAWFVKIVSTLCIQKPCLDNACLSYLSKGLNPSIAFEVIRRLNNPKLGFKFFKFCRVNLGIKHYYSTYNLVIRSLCEIGLHDMAKEALDSMRADVQTPHQSIISFLALSFAELGKFDIVKGLIAQAEVDNTPLPFFVYNKLMTIYIKRNRIDQAVCIFKEHLIVHSRPDTCSFNIVLRGLCRIKEIDKAFEYFNDMESFGCAPDIVSYNVLINGLCKIDEVDKAHNFLKEIRSKNVFVPNVVTYTSIISGFCKTGRMEEASVLFDEMIKFGIKPNLITFNALIDGHGKFGNMDIAVKLHEKMCALGFHPDIVTFTSLIDCFCRVGQVDKALGIWHELSARKLSPNEFTFTILLNALCKENRLKEASELLNILCQCGIVPQPFMYNPVIDGFCKAGNVDEANLIVERMEKNRCRHDKMTYTILIIGHCMKGRMLNAISIFNKMLENGCNPDNITTSSLISCLLRAGMPNEAFCIKKLVFGDMKLQVSPLEKNKKCIYGSRKNDTERTLVGFVML